MACARPPAKRRGYTCVSFNLGPPCLGIDHHGRCRVLVNSKSNIQAPLQQAWQNGKASSWHTGLSVFVRVHDSDPFAVEHQAFVRGDWTNESNSTHRPLASLPSLPCVDEVAALSELLRQLACGDDMQVGPQWELEVPISFGKHSAKLHWFMQVCSDRFPSHLDCFGLLRSMRVPDHVGRFRACSAMQPHPKFNIV